jgi:hypothetical protein
LCCGGQSLLVSLEDRRITDGPYVFHDLVIILAKDVELLIHQQTVETLIKHRFLRFSCEKGAHLPVVSSFASSEIDWTSGFGARPVLHTSKPKGTARQTIELPSYSKKTWKIEEHNLLPLPSRSCFPKNIRRIPVLEGIFKN